MGLFDIFKKKKKQTAPVDEETAATTEAAAGQDDASKGETPQQDVDGPEQAAARSADEESAGRPAVATEAEKASEQTGDQSDSGVVDHQSPASDVEKEEQDSAGTQSAQAAQPKQVVDSASQADRGGNQADDLHQTEAASQSVTDEPTNAVPSAEQLEADNTKAAAQSGDAAQPAAQPVSDSSNSTEAAAQAADKDDEASEQDGPKAKQGDQPTEQAEQQAYDQGLSKSRKSWSERFNHFLANFLSVDESFFEELEDTLIGADLGFDLAIQISDAVRQAVKEKNIKDKNDIRELIIEQMVNQYEAQGQDEDQSMHFAPAGQPTVMLFVGVNGVGKTTTVGKLAARYRQEGQKVLLAAADTFRAGAVKQLQEWGERTGVPVVTGKEKADPASVVYAAAAQAKAENYDILLVDTAGRLQNNVNLMQELSKMNRVVKKATDKEPEEVLLVLDATTGQNALQQAKLFRDSSEVTGIVLTKMDGTAKGGIVFAIRDQLHLPVKWIGFGEQVSDLRVFSAPDFVYGLFKDLVTN
ncbi:signal recognition particle-docking protein FtsY [Leuconostocaceae bacterium ESL0958]|nr:signal recognition particle-docking protein FtsY [Leuconostocaceae bacterium ESL0958]